MQVTVAISRDIQKLVTLIFKVFHQLPLILLSYMHLKITTSIILSCGGKIVIRQRSAVRPEWLSGKRACPFIVDATPHLFRCYWLQARCYTDLIRRQSGLFVIADGRKKIRACGNFRIARSTTKNLEIHLVIFSGKLARRNDILKMESAGRVSISTHFLMFAFLLIPLGKTWLNLLSLQLLVK